MMTGTQLHACTMLLLCVLHAVKLYLQGFSALQLYNPLPQSS